MLELVLRHLRNWFVYDIHSGVFTVQGGGLALSSLAEGQYFRIVGSVFNDGVYKYPAENLIDETFEGQIWLLAIPKALLDTVQEITAWQEKNGAGAASPYTSESFQGYTYTKATDSRKGGAVTWESVFRNRLNVWRKL